MEVAGRALDLLAWCGVAGGLIVPCVWVPGRRHRRSPAFHHEPETSACMEKFIETLEEQVLWIERFAPRPGPRYFPRVRPRLEPASKRLSRARSQVDSPPNRPHPP